MATEIRNAPLTDVTGEQLALTTTLAALGVPPKRDTVQCRGVMLRSTADFRLHVNPAIKAFLKTADSGATFTDYTSEVTDRNTATVATLNSLDTLANGDYLLVGADRQFGGIALDITNTNGTASVLAGHYWDGSAWQALVVTDGTASPAGTTLGKDGNVTWTMPTDWVQSQLNGVAAFWVRLSVSVALDASVTVCEAATLNKDSNRLYCYGHVLYLVPLGAEDGAIEAIHATATATLDVGWCFGATLPAIATDQSILDTRLPAALAANGGLPIEGVAGGVAVPVSLATAPALVAGTAIIGGARDAGPSQTVTRTCTDSVDIGTAAVDITVAPSAGLKIVALDVIVSTDTGGKVTIQMETSGAVLAGAYMAANTTTAFTLRGYLKGDTADKKLQIKHAVAGANGIITAIYFSEA